MDTLNWVLTAIGTIGGIPVLLAGGYQVFKYFRPLKITPFGTAYYEYHTELREYIVIVREVEVHVRRPTSTKARCLQLKGDKKCYPSADARFKTIEMWEQSELYPMRFATEIYDEEDLRNKGVIQGRIILGRHKSKYFPIVEVKAIREGDRIISKET